MDNCLLQMDDGEEIIMQERALDLSEQQHPSLGRERSNLGAAVMDI